jgi:hypothetical protein
MQDFQTELIHLRRLLRQDLGLRGATLAEQIRYGGRLLPRKVRASARRLAEAEGIINAPKLAKQLNWDQLAQDSAICRQYLQGRAQGRAHPLWLRVASWTAVVVLVIACLVFLRAPI